MKKTVFLSFLGAVVLVAAGMPAFAEVRVEVRNDIYVTPVAELVSTKTYPEVITLRNDLIQVQLVPNRGRVMLELTSLKHGVNFLHRVLKPEPMVLSSGLHGVEFGGYYLSVPWNTRDRQPFDLQYEIKNSGPEQAEVYLFGQDMFVRTLTECWVRLKDGSPVVEIEVTVSNTSKRSEKEFEFKDYSLLSVDTPGKNDNALVLPIDAAKIVSSHNDWLGPVGAEGAWPGSLQIWRNVRDFYRIRSFQPLSQPCVGVYYPGLKAACAKLWKPADAFPVVEAWTWGESYQSVAGSGPYFGFSTTAPGIKLKPEEKVSVHIYFVVLDNVQSIPAARDLYARAQALLK